MNEKELRARFRIPFMTYVVYAVPIGLMFFVCMALAAHALILVMDGPVGDAIIETAAGTASAAAGAMTYDRNPIPGANMQRDFQRGADAVKRDAPVSESVRKSNEADAKYFPILFGSFFGLVGIGVGCMIPKQRQLKAHGKQFSVDMESDVTSGPVRKICAAGIIDGQEVGINVEFVGPWKKIEKKNQDVRYCGSLRIHSIGEPTDHLVNIIDEHYEINSVPVHAKLEMGFDGVSNKVNPLRGKGDVASFSVEVCALGATAHLDQPLGFAVPLFGMRVDATSGTICIYETDLHNRIKVIQALAETNNDAPGGQ